MRDTRESSEFFDVSIHRSGRHLTKDYIDVYNAKCLPDENGIRRLDPLTIGHTEGLLSLLPLYYCRGSSLNDIKTSIIDVIQDRYIYLCEEMEKNSKKHIYYLDNRETNYVVHVNDGVQSDYHSVYSWLCWFYCLGAHPEKIKKIAPYLCEAGKDRLIDTVMRLYEPTRVVSKTCMNPETFGLLDEVIGADPEERIKLIERYLADWPKYIGHLDGLKSIGVACTSGVKSYADLIARIDGHYQGFWAWEVALVVKFFNVDDSTFKDNEFYPYDMVHFLD